MPVSGRWRWKTGGASPTRPCSSHPERRRRRLPTPGADQDHVHYLRTLEDSRSIIAALEGTDHAVVIGTGFIGLEVAASLRQREVAVTVVAPEEVPLVPIIGEKLGRFVQDLHEEHGVEFRLGHTVTEIKEKEVVLDDGATVPADLVVIGVGVVPNTGLAEQAGLNVDNGVVVDDRLRTSDPNIWAAGDVASYPDQNAGRVRIEHWVLAQRQGQAAARNILGHDTPFTDPPFFWSQHYDVPINVVGNAKEWDEEIIRGEAADHDVMVGYRKEGSIQAVASIYRDLESLRAEYALANQDQEALERVVRRGLKRRPRFLRFLFWMAVFLTRFCHTGSRTLGAMERVSIQNDQVDAGLGSFLWSFGGGFWQPRSVNGSVDADRGQLFLADGARNLPEWVSARFGLRHSTAAQLVRVARRLQDLPVLRSRFAAGELSSGSGRCDFEAGHCGDGGSGDCRMSRIVECGSGSCRQEGQPSIV